MTTTDLAWIMDDLDDVEKIDDSRVCRCNYEEDEKNQKIFVGYGILAETNVLNPIPRNSIFLYRLRMLKGHSIEYEYV